MVNSSGERSEAEELVDRLVQEIVGIGYDATTDFPACLLYKEFMELVPDAKVILSVRTSGDVWSKSTQSTIGQMGGIVNHAPSRFTSHFRGFAVLDNWIWRAIGIPKDYLHGSLQSDDLVNAYDKWIESIIQSVP